MNRTPSTPSTAALLVTGVSSCVFTACGITIALAIWLFTAFGPDFFPNRWVGIIGCGLAPAMIAAPAFIAGLRLHDKGNRLGAVRAFSMSFLGSPLLLAGALYFHSWT